MDTSIFDSVQGFAARVGANGELMVSASVPSPISISGTVDVDIAAASATVTTTPAEASSVSQDQVDVDNTGGGTEIVASGTRKGLMISNLDASITVFLALGGTPTVTTGFPLRPGETFQLPCGLTDASQVKGITSSGTARVAFIEFG